MEAIDALRYHQGSECRLGKNSVVSTTQPMAQKHVLDSHRYFLECNGQGDLTPGRARNRVWRPGAEAISSGYAVSGSAIEFGGQDLELSSEVLDGHQQSFSDDESLELGSPWFGSRG